MTSILTTVELAAARADIAKLLPDSCVIFSGSISVDGTGEVVTTWAAAGTVACRVDPMRGNEQQAGGAIEPFHRYILTLPYDAVITPANRVRVGSVDYSIVSVTAGDSWKLDTRAEIEKI